MKTVDRKIGRQRRHARVRKALSGNATRPRLSVMISNKHIYAQLVDDETARTLVAVSSSGSGGSGHKNIDGAKQVGQRVAELAKQIGIQDIVFDRSGFKYHGRVKAIADAVREAGFKF